MTNPMENPTTNEAPIENVPHVEPEVIHETVPTPPTQEEKSKEEIEKLKTINENISRAITGSENTTATEVANTIPQTEAAPTAPAENKEKNKKEDKKKDETAGGKKAGLGWMGKMFKSTWGFFVEHFYEPASKFKDVSPKKDDKKK